MKNFAVVSCFLLVKGVEGRRFELRLRLRREPRTRLGGAVRAAALDREVGTLSCRSALGGHAEKEVSGAKGSSLACCKRVILGVRL